jgi:hypothetical protein
MLHGELYDAVQKSGLERLYQLSVLAFAWSGQSLEALEILAGGAREAGDEFHCPPSHCVTYDHSHLQRRPVAINCRRHELFGPARRLSALAFNDI